jgi:hypothetical protein
MRCLILMLVLLLAGCKTTIQQGGASAQSIPLATQTMSQPENPAGSSEQQFVRVTQHPDGTVITERATTVLGGSQDMAAIVKAYGTVGMLKGLLLALCLSVGGIVAMSRGWPVLGLVLALGAASSIFVAWWAGLLSVGAAFLIYYAFAMGTIKLP